jgi:hypothetical protein
MNAAQHQLFNMLVQGASESRADLHSAAQDWMCILMLGAIILLGLTWMWVLTGGLSKYLSTGSPQERKALKDWLGESSSSA